MTKVRVNVHTMQNTSKARKEKRNGRDVVVVPSATLPDDVVMNGILYPAKEIENSYTTLERTPAPFGHPLINGEFVSASDPEGINIGYIGAWNENVQRRNGRVFLDKVIDIEVANRTKEGRDVLNRIEAEEPIHTSTGLYCMISKINHAEAEYAASDIIFDHDAILLDEIGAATPEQGVGLFVNSQGGKEEVRVINSALDMAEDELDWAGAHLVRSVMRLEEASIWERIRSVILDVVKDGRGAQVNSSDEGKEEEMADEKQLNELSAKVDKIVDTLGGLGDTIAASMTNALAEGLKPLNAHVEQLNAANKTREETERSTHVNKLVNSGMWSEDELADFDNSVIAKMAGKVNAGKADGIAGGFKLDVEEDDFAGVSLNTAIDGKKDS